MLRLDIAGMNIELSSEFGEIFRRFDGFVSNFQAEPDLKIRISSCEYIKKPQEKLFLSEDTKWLKRPDGSLIVYMPSRRDPVNEFICRLDVNSDWSSAEITCMKGVGDMEDLISGRVLGMLFRNRYLFNKGIVIHAAAISYQGKGLIFTAPSGTGKSTHAGLWERYRHAGILNDDNPAIKAATEKSHIYGTPWSGSTDKFRNEMSPLEAIIVLYQASENSICRLRNNEALPLLAPRCFLPYHDAGFMNMALEHLSKILKSTPVYLLGCKPDREAVELVYQCVM